MEEIYVSTDVESDGPIPGPNSMMSFGSAAYVIKDDSKRLVTTFSANLLPLEGASPDPETTAWWKTQPEAYAATQVNQLHPERAMIAYAQWAKELPGKPVFVGYPATYDFLFVYWYLVRFAGGSPFSFSALDIKSYAMAILRADFRETTKKRMPASWFDDLPHTHVALDDAIEQGAMFCNMLIASRRTR